MFEIDPRIIIACFVCNHFSLVSHFDYDPTCADHGHLAAAEYEGGEDRGLDASYEDRWG